MSTDYYSYHTFLYPFCFDVCSKKGIKQIVKKIEESNNWEFEKFEVKTVSDYNEYNYFYEYVKPALYNQDCIGSDNISYHFNYKIDSKNSFYTIVSREEEKEFKLNLDSISLTLFKTGVGILSYQLSNNNYKEFEEIIKINDFGRRIYPPFLNDKITGILPNVLAAKIELTFGEKTISEDFSSFNLQATKPFLPAHINDILGDIFSLVDNKKIKIRPVLDDRMFTLCLALSDEITQFNEFDEKNNNYKYISNYSISQNWHKFVFIDYDSATTQSRIMMARLLEQHTYDRWIESGTMYGVTRYSFMMLSSFSNGGMKDLLKFHLRTMYHQMVLLSLAQRASILNFSGLVSQVSGEQSNVKDVQKLHNEYIHFVNKYFFDEVTAQEQGIDLYDLLNKHMGNKRALNDLIGELNELHNSVKLESDAEENRLMFRITIIGAISIIPTLLTGFLGMNVFDSNLAKKFKHLPNIGNFIGNHETLIIFLFIIISLTFILINPIKKFLYKIKFRKGKKNDTYGSF